MSQEWSGKGPARLHGRVSVQMRVVFQDVGEVLEAFSTNLGAGGMKLTTDRDVAIGSRMQLRFTLPGISGEFTTGAEVAWRQQDGRALGLRFLELASAEQSRVETFVTERWSQLARSVVVASASPQLHDAMQGQLAQRGLRSLCARDGSEAELLLGDLSGVGIVLLDLLLPPEDGLSVLHALRARPALLHQRVPVALLIEGIVTPIEMDRLRAEGATAVLSYGRPSDWVKIADAALRLIGKPAR